MEYELGVLSDVDYPALIALWRRAGLEHKPRGRDSAAEYRRQVALPMVRFIGAWTPVEERYGVGVLAGSILATHDGRKGWLNRLAVDPRHRRRGLAGRLISAAEAWLRDQGLEIHACLIEGWNTTSLRVLQHYGYLDFEGVHYLTKRRDDDV